jgi:hypothetical protein
VGVRLGLPPLFPRLSFVLSSSAPSPLHPHRPRFTEGVDLHRRLRAGPPVVRRYISPAPPPALLCGDFFDSRVLDVMYSDRCDVTADLHVYTCFRLLTPSSDLCDALLFLTIHMWSCSHDIHAHFDLN